VSDELRAIFEEEAGDLLRSLNQALVHLEARAKGAGRDEKLREVFRIAHTLKGSAAAAGRHDFAALAHALETLLDAIRKGALQPSREVVDASLAAADLLSAGVTQSVDATASARAVRALEELVKQPEPPVPAPKRSAPRAKKEKPLDALSRHVTELLRAPTVDVAHAIAAAAGELLKTLTPGTPAARVAQALGDAFAPEGAAHRPRIGEAAFMAVDFFHSDGAEEEAQAVLEVLTPRAPAPAPEPAPQDTVPTAEAPSQATVRVSVAMLDALHYRIEELVAVKLRLEFERQQVDAVQAALATSRDAAAKEGVRKLEQVHNGLSQQLHQLGLLSQELQNDLKEARMVPVATALDPLHRTVRDLAHAEGKDAALEVQGANVRVDKRLLELVRDPLTQLIRNAVAHGLETAKEREGAKKPPRGRVRVAVESRESQVFIEVEDDGRGIDEARLKEEAVRRGVLDAAAAPGLSRRDALNLIFAPGLSTARSVTDVSGRGVGLDVVRENVSRLGGRIEFFTEPGQGTRFVLALPLTLAASRGLTVAAGKNVYCLPLNPVDEVLKVSPNDIGQAQGRLALSWRHQAVTFAQLEDLLAGGASLKPTRDFYAVVLAVSDRRLALGVTELLGQHEMVVKAPAAGTPPMRFVAGATTLADGRLVTVLDPPALVEAAGLLKLAVGTDKPTATVLVVDDSLTSRAMVASVLEQRGLRTLTAHDGEAAWAVLQQHSVDLVVSDVEMPRLDGLGLVQRIRTRGSKPDLPCLLLTSLESPEMRARGAQAGADAYFVKQRFEPGAFLSLVADLLGS
jgi:two-component system chemotaxis sensor kinase CheA